MSDLNETSVTPKSIEREKGFAGKTYFALLNHPSIQNIEGVQETTY